ncbi:hypothetical protein I79_005611 [Cricetulus griseus]|uniref:Uncharacterized protein n=1 Tax=Cricetulus griseus TaxID=10029 RepID=G3H5M6_CRIGR|nr:hypothetical protein I79_005611 [Cricetulus griseus]
MRAFTSKNHFDDKRIQSIMLNIPPESQTQQAMNNRVTRLHSQLTTAKSYRMIKTSQCLQSLIKDSNSINREDKEWDDRSIWS